MGKFRQETIDRWQAADLWLRHGKEGERIDDYMPDKIDATRRRHAEESKVKQSKKRKTK